MNEDVLDLWIKEKSLPFYLDLAGLKQKNNPNATLLVVFKPTNNMFISCSGSKDFKFKLVII